MSELEELLPWMLAGASSRSCFFVIKKKAEEGFESERTQTLEKG